MTHPKLILKRMQCPTIHLHLPSSKYALTRSYKFGHYISFWKVSKNTFWVKASYMSMEDSIAMIPKGFLRGHLKLSKNSKNTLIGPKLRNLCIGEVDLFCKIAKSQKWPKLQFLSNGPNFLCLSWVCTMTHLPLFYFFHLFWFLFHLNQIKSIINNENIKNHLNLEILCIFQVHR